MRSDFGISSIKGSLNVFDPQVTTLQLSIDYPDDIKQEYWRDWIEGEESSLDEKLMQFANCKGKTSIEGATMRRLFCNILSGRVIV